MRTEVMISELRKESEKRKDDNVFTFQTNISVMCRDVANRLEELNIENQTYKQTIEELRNRLAYVNDQN